MSNTKPFRTIAPCVGQLAETMIVTGVRLVGAGGSISRVVAIASSTEKQAASRKQTAMRVLPRFIGSEPPAHVLPLHDLLVDLAQAAADHAAEKIQELQ